MTGLRVLSAAGAVSLAIVLQTTVLPYLSWQGVVPNLVLLVVVATGLARGSQFAMVLGFVAGVLLDLAPPSDHVAGRWALALMLVGYVAGRLRQDGATPSPVSVLATVAACSFLGSSVFAISGLVLQDTPSAVPDLLEVVLVGVVLDLVLTAFVVPLTMRLFTRLEPDRVLV